MEGTAHRRCAAVLLVLACTTHLSHALSLPAMWLPPSLRAHPLAKRASTTTVPAPIQIAPSQYWDGVDGQWSSFAVQVGEHPQNIRAFVGTSVTSLLTVAAGTAGGCPSYFEPNCEDSRGGVFNPNNSLTWIPHSIYTTGVEENLVGQLPATVGFDTVTLGWQGSGGPTVEHNVVFNINPDTFWLGIFGISPTPTNFTTYGDPQPSFLNQLATNNSIPSMSYGYTAGNQYRLNNLKVYGSLTFGGYDQNRFTPTNVTFPFYQDVSRDLLVDVHSITSDAGSNTNLLPGGQIRMLIDSAVPEIWLPESACKAFEDAFGITYDNTSELYLVNDALHSTLQAQNANVTFTIGGTAGGSTVEIVLPYGAFDLTAKFPRVQNTSTYFPLKRAANDTQYTLGRTFLQEAYLIADYDRQNFTVAPCLWDQQKVQQAQVVPILRANETHSGSGGNGSDVSAGAIAGIVIAIVAVIALIGLAVFLVRRRKNANRKKLAELEAKNAANGDKASTDSNHEGKPFIGSGELAGSEIHELTAPNKSPAQELDSALETDPNKVGYSEMEGGEYYAPGKAGNAAEMDAGRPIYEMSGSDVHELPAPVPGKDNKY